MPIGRNASGWASDARYAMRGLCRAPLFAIVALATLAVGTGANTAVFSVVNGVLLEPLPYPGSEELVSVNHIAPGAGLSELGGRLGLSASMFFTYAEENRTFEHFGVWDRGTASVTGVGDPEQVDIVGMSDGVLASLAVPTAIGRPFGTADHDAGAAPTAV